MFVDLTVSYHNSLDLNNKWSSPMSKASTKKLMDHTFTRDLESRLQAKYEAEISWNMCVNK